MDSFGDRSDLVGGSHDIVESAFVSPGDDPNDESLDAYLDCLLQNGARAWGAIPDADAWLADFRGGRRSDRRLTRFREVFRMTGRGLSRRAVAHEILPMLQLPPDRLAEIEADDPGSLKVWPHSNRSSCRRVITVAR